MLSQLSVKNLAVVERLDLPFELGMSVVTGETGAGKSILLQALNLALGRRGDSTLVRQGKTSAEVSAVFDVAQNQKIQAFLQDRFLADEGECVLRRIISHDGRSKAFINGISTPLSVVRSVGELLIDMHDQNEHQLLLRPDQQRELLDAYAQLSEDCTALNAVVAQHKSVSQQIDELSGAQVLQQQQQTLLQHQLQELDDVSLNQNELDHIEADFKVSANAANLVETISAVLSQLEQDSGAGTQLLNLSHALSNAASLDEKLTPIADLLVSAQVQTQECVYELTHYLNSLSVDEQAAAELEDRLGELHDLARKHQCQINQLLSVRDKIFVELDRVSAGGTSLDVLNAQKAKLAKQYQVQAQQLSIIRTEKAQVLSGLVTEVMQVLGMPGSVFKINLPRKTDDVYYNGAETVDFLVKTNMGQDLKPLKKVASGGELSRISLAISVVSSSSEYTPTLVFDEVDVGISGAVAQVVGQKLKQLSSHYQVICITHLAQVAAFGQQHLRVSKTQNNDGAQTTVEQLSTEGRIDEIARILGGAKLTDKARFAAEEMIVLSV